MLKLHLFLFYLRIENISIITLLNGRDICLITEERHFKSQSAAGVRVKAKMAASKLHWQQCKS